MVSAFQRGDFNIRQEGRPGTWKTAKNGGFHVELQALLDEDDSQTQKQLGEQLDVSQQASSPLREMGKIHKTGSSVPH